MVEQVQSRIMGFIVSNYLFGDESRAPEPDESLLESGIVDSTGILELIQFLESDFALEVKDSETVPDNLGSVANLTRFVLERSPDAEPAT